VQTQGKWVRLRVPGSVRNRDGKKKKPEDRERERGRETEVSNKHGVKVT